jgi:lysophospholipase L1-like esterase
MRIRLILSPLLLVACNAGEGGDEETTLAATTAPMPMTMISTGMIDPTSGPESSTGPVLTSSSSTTGPEETEDSGSFDDSTGMVDPPEPPAVHYVGRYDDSDPMRVRMGWSGVGAVFRFHGTDAGVRLDDNGRYFTVVVDGQVQATLATSPGEQTYPLAVGLPLGEHTVELYRRTEGSFGPTTFLGVELDGELMAPPPVQRRIEIVGDSITCGYGNEGVSPCSFSAETENHYLTYGAIAARTLGAELSTVAWSGKGVVNNFDMDVFEPLPQIYDRVVATDAAAWGFAWQPDVVVINLGTNDFSTGGDPPEEVFVPAYVAFLGHLRDVYPGAFILPVAPTLFGDEAILVAGYLQSAVDQRHAMGDLDVAFADVNVPWNGSGCDGHPNLEAHAGMAERLVQALQAHLGW